MASVVTPLDPADVHSRIVQTLGLSFDSLPGLADHVLQCILGAARSTKGLLAAKKSGREDQLFVLALADATPLAFPQYRMDSLFQVSDAEPSDPAHTEYHALVSIPLLWHTKVCGMVLVSNASGHPHDALLRHLAPLVPVATSSLLGNFWTSREASDAHQFFLAMMSHEIRTPLCGVIGMSRLLQTGTNLSRDQREYVDIVYRCGMQLLEIINDILDYSKMDAGRMQLESVPFAVRDAVAEALEVVALKAQEKALPVTATVDASVPDFVLGDRKRYRQILINLLANAVKFTDRGHVVCRVRYVLDVEGVVTEVEDTGMGIDTADFERIFHTFVQVKGTALEASEGTGLGLAICKRLVELMKGQIGVKYSKVGVGTCMAFRLPLRRTDALDDRAWQRLAQALSSQTLLVADANVQRRIRLSELLMRLGARVLACSTMEEAHLYLRNTTVDVVCLDPDLAPQCGTSQPTLLLQDALANASETALTTALYRLVVQPGATPAVSRVDPVPTPTPGTATSDLLILVVEDNDINLRVAVETLRQLGYAPSCIHTAANGILAVQQCQRTTYDVILMDLKMPMMDGYQATRLILDHYARARKVPPTVIAMTAFVMGSEREQCKQVGMKGFLPKPLLLQELQAMLDVVRKRRTKKP